MHFYIVFIFSVLLLIVTVSCCVCYRWFWKRNKKRFKYYYLLPLPCLLLSIGLFIPMSLNFSSERKLLEWKYPAEIELPYWKTVEDIDFTQWKNIDYFYGGKGQNPTDTSACILSDNDLSGYANYIIEIQLSENLKEISDINFSMIAVRSLHYEKNLAVAKYEAVYTKERFYLERRELIDNNSWLKKYNNTWKTKSTSLENFLVYASLIRDGDILNALDEESKAIYIIFQMNSTSHQFGDHWVTAINQDGQEKTLIPSSLFEIVPTTYLHIVVYRSLKPSLLYFKDPPFFTFDEFMKFAEYID